VRVCLALTCATVVALSGAAAAPGDDSAIEVTRLGDRLYLLTTDQGAYTTNTIASVGDDGVLLVDTQARGDAERLKSVVEGFGRGAPRIIINTHRHVEHVGGNAVFGEEPIVIAHSLVRGKLRSGSSLFEEYGKATLPDITLDDSLSLYFNGEHIRLIALPGGHDDNEIIVHFTDSKVVHLSSLVNGFNFPSVDSDGDPLKFAELVARAIELLPPDVTIVSGHNRTGTWHELHAYHDMLVRTAEVVRSGLAEGLDASALKQAGALDEWASYAGSYVSTDRWIDYLVRGLEGRERRQTVFEPLYFALRDHGIDAAIARYRELRQDHPDEYGFRDVDLVIIGDKLLEQGRIEPAVRFLELGLSEYPDGDYAYYLNYDLARAHRDLGDREAALAFCRTAYELAPDNQAVAALLEELEQAP
jgi:cyclase